MKFLKSITCITIFALNLVSLGFAEQTFEHVKKSDNSNVSVCELPQAVGRCRAAFPRFYFNKEINACEPFTWGGCDDNGNNFKTLEECLETCLPKPVKEKEAKEGFWSFFG